MIGDIGQVVMTINNKENLKYINQKIKYVQKLKILKKKINKYSYQSTNY